MLKGSQQVAPLLLDQITAYQENFFNVAALHEDSQAKAAALATIDEMEEHMQQVQDQHQAAEFQSLKRIGEWRWGGGG